MCCHTEWEDTFIGVTVLTGQVFQQDLDLLILWATLSFLEAAAEELRTYYHWSSSCLQERPVLGSPGMNSSASLVTTLSLETETILLQGLQNRIQFCLQTALLPFSLLTCGVATRVVDLYRGSLIKLHDEAVVISFLTPQVWAGCG